MTNADEILKKRLTHLKIIYGMSVTMAGLYLLKFNLQHGSLVNPIIVPAWVALTALPPLCLFHFKNLRFAAVTILVPLATMLLCLLFATGGVDSPGFFWLTIAPLTMAALMGFNGVLLGNAFVISCVAFFWIMKKSGHYLNVLDIHSNHSFEKVFHLLALITCTSVALYLYLREEQKQTLRLHEKNADVENLLRVLLHDVANTLSSMTYQLVRVKEEGDHPHSMQEIDKIERAVGDIGNLLTQVRQLKSVKDGKASLPIKSTALSLVLHEVFESAEITAAQKGIKLSLDIPPENIFVLAEKTILSNIILINVINNAIKFSQPGGRVDIRGQIQEDHVNIEIQDYGIGIPSDLLASIFSLNVKTNRPGTLDEKGTGYGLPLAKEYLQMMSGAIEVTSSEIGQAEQPRGTKVKITLPLAQ